MQVVELKSAFLKNEVIIVNSLHTKLKNVNYEIDRLNSLSLKFDDRKINKKDFDKQIREIIKILISSIQYARTAIEHKSKSAFTKSTEYANRVKLIAGKLKLTIEKIIGNKLAFASNYNSEKSFHIKRKLDKIWMDIQRFINIIIETSETIINKTKTEFSDSTRYISDNLKKSYNFFNKELNKNYKELLKLLNENKFIYEKLSEVREISQEPEEIRDTDKLLQSFKPFTKINNNVDLITKKFRLINNSILNNQGFRGRKGLSAIESPSELYSSCVFLNGKITDLSKKFKDWAKKSKLILQRKHKLPMKTETEDGSIIISEVEKDSKLFGTIEKKHALAIGLLIAACLVLPRLLNALTNRAHQKVRENR